MRKTVGERSLSTARLSMVAAEVALCEGGLGGARAAGAGAVALSAVGEGTGDLPAPPTAPGGVALSAVVEGTGDLPAPPTAARGVAAAGG